MLFFPKRKTPWTRKGARKLIADLDIVLYTHQAVERGLCSAQDAILCDQAYRQFWYIQMLSARDGYDLWIAPNELSNIIWRLHFLDGQKYRAFSHTLIGRVVPYISPESMQENHGDDVYAHTVQYLFNHDRDKGFTRRYVSLSKGAVSDEEYRLRASLPHCCTRENTQIYHAAIG